MMLRSVMVGMVLVATVGHLSGCDADPYVASRHDADVPPGPAASGGTPSASASASSCPNARIEFGPIRKRGVLTEVAQEVTITSPTGGRLDAPLRPVRQYTAQVVASGDVPREQVYEAFLRKVNPDAQAPQLGDVATGGTGGTGSMTVKGPGRFVQYEGVFAREATFRYGCGAISVSGTVSSWLIPVSGALSCDRKLDSGKTMAVEAAALGCTD